ncbi:DNA helicase [Microbacterium phage Pumpernickel]|uniref:DNA helicase n=1 Tax=Microbacterium phage Pumpernickel TaxID=2885983 RepID=A0AAE8Y8L2_9CAUD|nr:DNA helicase [Microbacterium phage Pumpernickel]UDL15936.1 DNA helicase [Microbacterium phage Pumpernickel]
MTIALSPEQKRAVNLAVNSRDHIFITGRAGCGKSVVLREIAKRKGEKGVIAASTGIAALNVGGQTLHRLVGVGTALPADLGVDLHRVKSKRLWLNDLETIIIDEISMVSADLMDSIDRMLRYIRGNRSEPFGGLQLVMIGDPYQLPPVATKEDRKYYQSQGYNSPWFFDAQVWEEVGFKTIELQTIFRQNDDTFKDLLNAVRDGSADPEQVGLLNALGARAGKTENALLLGGTNKIVSERNRQGLAKLPGRTHVYEARVSRGFGREEPAERRLELKQGAHVMMLNNDDQDRWVNGSRGIITNVWPDSISVQLDDTEEVVDIGRHAWVPGGTPPDGYADAPKYWQLPVKLAWAVTIHKSQGLSLPEIEVDMGQYGAFEGGQTYVALSRAIDPWGVYFKTPLTMADIKVDPFVKKFFTELERVSEDDSEEV